MLYKLLHKAIEFYLCYLGLSTSVIQDTETKIEDPWGKLFTVFEFIGNQLNWEPYLINFTSNWSKEAYWQKSISFCQSKTKSYPLEDTQLLFSLPIYFVYCLFEYNASLTPESSPGQIPSTYLLVEAFSDPNLPSLVAEPKTKKRKSDVDGSQVPCLTKKEVTRSAEDDNLDHVIYYDDIFAINERSKKDAKIWDHWGKWSSCSVSCGVGKMTRWRHCVSKGCATGEKEAQIKTCTLPPC